MINNNSDFLFGFEALMSNPNGDPDQENKPRMDYETSTLLVSDSRRKRDVRDFLKNKNYKIFIDTLNDKKVSMDVMFRSIVNTYLKDNEKIKKIIDSNEQTKKVFDNGFKEYKDCKDYLEVYDKMSQNSKKNKKKKEITELNNYLLTEIIKDALIDIRLFGSAMAVENISKTYTGPVQMNWGYSLHPVELIKSNAITSIMNDDSSTFGKKYKVYYALVAHYGVINKYSAKLTGMTESDRDIFRKALVQGMLNKQTDSKQGQTPMFYIEIIYKPEFDGYLGDLRRFIDVKYEEEKPIRKISDIEIDFSRLEDAIDYMKKKEYIDKVIGWVHPFAKDEIKLPKYEEVDLLSPIKMED